MKSKYRKTFIVLILTVTIICSGCAQKLTDERTIAKGKETEAKTQALIAESEALSDAIHRFGAKYPTNPRLLEIHPVLEEIAPKAKLPPTKIRGNRTERLVVLSPLQSVRWLRALGYEVKITSHIESITRDNFGSIAIPGRRYVRPDEDADPQFIRFGKSKIMITSAANFGDVFMIYDQFSNPRVVTYQEF